MHGRPLYTTKFVRDRDLADKDVLELGCGYGWFTLNALDRRVKSYTGIEPTASSLETAVKHVTATISPGTVTVATSIASYGSCR